jgi:hypothetical protein
MIRAHTIITEASGTVRAIVRRIGAGFTRPRSSEETTQGREGGEEGGREEVVERAVCSVVRGRSDTQQTWVILIK